jgi:hypothetical protein
MRSSQPPTVATWTLKHFGSSNEALTGDLVEEYRQGRSTAWYWRQVLIVVVVGCVNDIRRHGLLTMRAIIIGWAALILSSYLIVDPLYRLYWRAVSVLGLNHGGPSWLHYYTYPSLLIPCISGVLSGWLVARFHRPHRVSMVFMYVISVLLAAFPEFLRLAKDSLSSSRFLPYLLVYLLDESLFVVSILFGGLQSTNATSSDPKLSKS